MQGQAKTASSHSLKVEPDSGWRQSPNAHLAVPGEPHHAPGQGASSALPPDIPGSCLPSSNQPPPWPGSHQLPETEVSGRSQDQQWQLGMGMTQGTDQGSGGCTGMSQSFVLAQEA